ncbi:MAG: CBS domain-containing protein [Betaproteobacteria bacterium]|nr:MAG: CBS domain-containing protein [Betaproteobacteria bacterium]
MTISAFCNRAVVTIQRQATVDDAARLMRSNHIGDVVVVDGADTRMPVGMLTDRDIVVRVVARGLVATQTQVGSIMSSPVLVLREGDGFIEALDKMTQRGVRRAPVVDRDGRLQGLIAVDDVVRLLARELAKVGALIMHGRDAEIQHTEKSLAEGMVT